MQIEHRPSGIKSIGDIRWGTHFCQFFKTKQDLADILVPYFEAGLRNNEFCMWVTADPLNADEARDVLAKKMPDVNDIIAGGRLEIVSYDEWYLKDGGFDQKRVLDGWVGKMDTALEKGFAGLRLTGNTFWLEKSGWQRFNDYEDTVNQAIGSLRMLALCSYSLDRCSAPDIIDVLSTHQFALAKKEGKWIRLETDENRRQREAFSAAGNIIICLSPDRRITDLNLEAERFYGYSREELMGQDYVSMCIAGAGEGRLKNDFAKVLSGQTIRGFETPVATESGLRILEWTISPTRNLDGDITGAINIGQDITERKRAEASLSRSDERLKTIIDMVPVGLAVTTPREAILDANNQMLKLFGFDEFSKDEFVKTPVADFFVDKAYRKKLADQSRNGKIRSYEVRFKTRDGSVFWGSLSTARAVTSSSEMLLITAIQDINERKVAEEKLIHSEANLKRSQEIAHLGSWELDLERDVLYWSDEVYRIFGLQPQEFAATYEAFLEAVHPDDRAAVDDAYSGSLREGKDSYEIEHRIVRPHTGEIRIVHEKCKHFRNEEGKVLQSLGMVHDITERKRIEEEVNEYAQRLEHTNKELQSFNYSVSHDLRAPLRAIDGFSQILLEDYQDRLDDEGRRVLSVIRSNTKKMGRLIDDLLSLSRVGRQEMKLSRVLMNDLVKEIWGDLMPTFVTTRDIDLEFKQLPDCRADPSQIRQVWSNLLTNAIKFTRKRKKAVIEITGYVEQNKNIYCVSDNGVGFDMKYSDKLFGVFQRLHPETEFEGTGVGLAIVKRIVHRHGGDVWATGEVDKGARFCFSLPVQ